MGLGEFTELLAELIDLPDFADFPSFTLKSLNNSSTLGFSIKIFFANGLSNNEGKNQRLTSFLLQCC